MDNLRDLLRKALSNDDEIYGIPGVVTDVDIDAKTCDIEPLNGDADLLGVRLQAGIGKGMLIVPVEGSIVIVSMLTKEDGFVSMFSEIEQILYHDGENGGIIIKDKLAAEVAKVTSFMNAIKNAFDTAVPVASDGGAAMLITFKAAVAAMETPDLSDITNDKILH